MPLFTNDIGEGRVAYSALETRAAAAESHVAALQSQLAAIAIHEPLTLVEQKAIESKFLEVTKTNAELAAQQDRLVASKADISLGNVIAAYGLTIAVAESTMPDRAIPSVAATLQSYLILENGDVGLRFWQPEIGGGAFATSTFELVKTPAPAGDAAPLRLFRILQAKLAAYASPFWQPRAPSVALLVVCAKTLADTALWNFAFLLDAAKQIAGLEAQLAGTAFATSDGGFVAAYRARSAELVQLTSALVQKTTPVAGDFFAIESALDASTSAAIRLG